MRDGHAGAPRVALLALAAILVLAACTRVAPASQRVLAPKLKPPAIIETGVLRVAVDGHYPPFASLDGSRAVGMDVDVAEALAAKLGLKAEFVNVPADQMAAALRGKRADVALGGISVTEAALTEVTVATSYLSDAPVLFARDASVTAEALDAERIAVQQGSPAYWLLRGKLPQDRLVVFKTLREAFDAAGAGKADAVAGDAIVAGYIHRDFAPLYYAGQIGDAAPLAVMTGKDASAVETSVRDAMDELAATGVLDAIRGKWVGDLPALRATSSAQAPPALDSSPGVGAALATGLAQPLDTSAP